VKSERLMWASGLSAYLFPYAIYHLIAVSPQIKGRVMFTNLYRETIDKISREALLCSEMVLSQYRVLAIKKIVLRGDPSKEIVNYVKQRNIDLVVLTSGVTEESPPRLVGAVSRELIASLPNPLLIYPPSAKKFEGGLSKALIVPVDELVTNPSRFMDAVKRLAVRGVEEALVMSKEEGKLRRDVEKVLEERGVKVTRLSLPPFPEGLAEMVKLSGEVDIVITGKSYTGRKVLSEYQETVAGLMSAPVIMA